LGLGSTPHEIFEPLALSRFPNWKYKALDLSAMDKMFKEKIPVEAGRILEDTTDQTEFRWFYRLLFGNILDLY